jgi:CxxC motif-containing protein (DUF1111 family)
MSIVDTLRQRKQSATTLLALLLITAVDCLTVGFHAQLYAHSTIGGIPPGLSEEYFTGGRKGTVFDTTSRCFEMPSPAIEADPKLSSQFPEGEVIFEADFVTDPKAPFGGLGPVYLNTSCKNCHPNYGRGRRVDKFSAQFGNGYTVLVHTPDSKLVDGYLFMLQTMTTPPYVPPAKGVSITWNNFVDEHGNKYPDGTPYNKGKSTEGTLIYPTADLIEPLLPLPANYKVSLEATIGLYGTGLLDAIRDEDIIAEYEHQQAMAGIVKGKLGKWIEEPDGKKRLGRFTFHNTRATLQNGPGFNGIWNVFNMTRVDRPKLFATQQWIDKQAELGLDVAPLTAHQPVELTQEQLDNLMTWSRGLAVPAARNLDKPAVKRGKELFHSSGCGSCHKPAWVTGDYEHVPGYSQQKIWPYTDMLMHDMGKENQGFTATFRTPPLWGRGLMKNVVDHTDMMHDLRARDFEEAILWHFGESVRTREAFRNLSAADRAALIEFLESI